MIEIHKVGFVGMDCIGLAQDKDRWRALVNTLMKVLIL
jgi:hypothetical protein